MRHPHVGARRCLARPRHRRGTTRCACRGGVDHSRGGHRGSTGRLPALPGRRVRHRLTPTRRGVMHPDPCQAGAQPAIPRPAVGARRCLARRATGAATCSAAFSTAATWPGTTADESPPARAGPPGTAGQAPPDLLANSSTAPPELNPRSARPPTVPRPPVRRPRGRTAIPATPRGHRPRGVAAVGGSSAREPAGHGSLVAPDWAGEEFSAACS